MQLSPETSPIEAMILPVQPLPIISQGMIHSIDCMILFVVSYHFAIYSARKGDLAHTLLGGLLVAISLCLLFTGTKP
jgi:hypothetical protein